MYEYRRLRGPRNYDGVNFSDIGKKLAQEPTVAKDLELLGLKYHNLIAVDSSGNTTTSGDITAANKITVVADGWPMYKLKNSASTNLGGWIGLGGPSKTLEIVQSEVGAGIEFFWYNGSNYIRSGSMVSGGRWIFGNDAIDNGLDGFQINTDARVIGSIKRRPIGDFQRSSSDTYSATVSKGNKWICVARMSYLTNATIRCVVITQNSEESITIDLNTTYYAEKANMKVRHQSYNTRTRYIGMSSDSDTSNKYIWINVDHADFDISVSVCVDGIGFIDAPFTSVTDGTQPTQRVLASLTDRFGGDSSTEITLFDTKVSNTGFYGGHLCVNGDNNDTDHGRGLTIGSGTYRTIFGLTNVQNDGSYIGMTKIGDQAWVGARDSGGFVVGKHDGAALRFTTDKIELGAGLYYGSETRRFILGFDYEPVINHDYTVIGGPAHWSNGVGSGVKIMVGYYDDYSVAYRITPSGRHLFGTGIVDDGTTLAQFAGSLRVSDSRNGGITLGAFSSNNRRVIGGLDYGGIWYDVCDTESHYWRINSVQKMSLNDLGLNVKSLTVSTGGRFYGGTPSETAPAINHILIDTPGGEYPRLVGIAANGALDLPIRFQQYGGRSIFGNTPDDGATLAQFGGSGRFTGNLIVGGSYSTTQTIEVRGLTGGTTAGSSLGFQMSDATNDRYARFELGSDNKMRLFIYVGGNWTQMAIWG